MEQFWSVLHYVGEHPAVAAVAVIVAYGVYRVLNRKPKVARQAEERFEQLRKERTNYYNQTRRPQ